MKCSKCEDDSFGSIEALDEHDKNFHQSPKYICDICKTTFTEQFKFFEHLKAHYESSSLPTISDYEAASILVDASNSGPVQSTNGLTVQGGSHAEFLEEEEGTKLTRTSSSVKKVYKIEHVELSSIINSTDSDLMPSTSSGVAGNAGLTLVDETPEKVLLTCPKCRRTFRREKTFQTHVTTICGSGVRVHLDGQENGDNDRGKGKVKKGKLKPEVVMMKDETSQDLEDESIVESIEINLGVDDQIDFDDDDDEDGILADGNLCTTCDEVFSSRAKLETHLKKVHPDLSSSPNNGKGAKKKKGVAQKRQEVLKCSECNRIFNHRNSLVYHMRSHTGERPHQCEMCGKSFFATSALKVHMRLHSGEKPYKCDHCGRHFRQWGDLKYHVISIHSDIRQYQCEFCGKDFARKYSLIVHRRIHTGERNYKCEFCGKCFRAASYLQNHRRIHTGEKPHACSICGKPFRVRSDMKRHMASHNRDHGHSHAAVNATSAINNQQTSHSLQPGTTVVTVSNATASQLIVGPQMSQQIIHTVRGGQTIQVPVTTTQMIQQHGTLEDSNEGVISGDISEGTPINIILNTEDCSTEDGSIRSATVTTLQASDLPDGVIYQNRDGQMEAVTIRESSNGTLYHERRTDLSSFEGSSSISSADYFEDGRQRNEAPNTFSTNLKNCGVEDEDDDLQIVFCRKDSDEEEEERDLADPESGEEDFPKYHAYELYCAKTKTIPTLMGRNEFDKATKEAEKISNLANGMMSSLQEKYGY